MFFDIICAALVGQLFRISRWRQQRALLSRSQPSFSPFLSFLWERCPTRNSKGKTSRHGQRGQELRRPNVVLVGPPAGCVCSIFLQVPGTAAEERALSGEARRRALRGLPQSAGRLPPCPPTPVHINLCTCTRGNMRHSTAPKQQSSAGKVLHVGDNFYDVETQVSQERQCSSESKVCNKDGTHCTSRQKPGQNDELEKSTHWPSHPARPRGGPHLVWGGGWA